MLTLQPDSFVLAMGMAGKPATAVIMLYNTTSDTVAYKIKANDPDAVSIDNPRKAISPLSCIDVSISVVAAKANLKLKIVSTILHSSGTLNWNHAYRQVLSVRVLTVSEQTITLPGVKLQGCPQDTQAKVAELQLTTAELLSAIEAVRQQVEEKKGVRSTTEQLSANFRYYFFSFIAGLCVAYVARCFASSII